MNINNDLKNQLAALSDGQRARLLAITHRHIEACRRQKLEVDEPGRVLKEALDLMALEDKSGKREIEDWTKATISEGLQQQRYELYRTPTAE